MMKSKLPSNLVLGVCLLGGAIVFQCASVLAQAPPSGEAPRMAPPRADDPNQADPDPTRPNKDTAKGPLITMDSRQALLGGLYDELAKVTDPEAAKPLLDAIWKVWSFSGSATSDVLIERARASAADGSIESSLKFLNAVTELQPDFAQGWFLRAMVYKLNNDSHRMLADLRRTLAIDPRHFEAMKVIAFELNELGEKKPAREAYNKLIKLYPASAKSTDPVLQSLTRDFGGQDL